jgi:TATA-binding protein-associated factor
MDRAHRLGQKRTVNVYRLITRDTLEEKIMSLQKFKVKNSITNTTLFSFIIFATQMHMAKTVVNEENASMQTMDTGALLDMIDTGSGDGSGGAGSEDDAGELMELQKLINL